MPDAKSRAARARPPSSKPHKIILLPAVRFPVKAKTPLSRAYPYYNPERVAVSKPQEITVTQ